MCARLCYLERIQPCQQGENRLIYLQSAAALFHRASLKALQGLNSVDSYMPDQLVDFDWCNRVVLQGKECYSRSCLCISRGMARKIRTPQKNSSMLHHKVKADNVCSQISQNLFSVDIFYLMMWLSPVSQSSPPVKLIYVQQCCCVQQRNFTVLNCKNMSMFWFTLTGGHEVIHLSVLPLPPWSAPVQPPVSSLYRWVKVMNCGTLNPS